MHLTRPHLYWLKNRETESRLSTSKSVFKVGLHTLTDSLFLSLAYISSCNKNKTVQQSEQDRRQCISILYRQHTKFLYWFDFPAKMPRIKGHIMVNTCQSSTSDIQRKCLNPDPNDIFGRIPVEGSDNLTYRNRYCAVCNGNALKTTTNWRYELICNPRNHVRNKTAEELRLNSCMSASKPSCTIEDEKYFKNNCTWYYAPPKGHPKKNTICSPVKTCPKTPVITTTASKYRKLTLKCQAYMGIVYHNGVFYKNFHCALCHGVKPIQLQSMPITIVFPTISIFFETPKQKVKRHIDHSTDNNGTNITRLLNNGSYCTKNKTKVLPGERYLTFAGFVVSMASLVMLLILYTTFKCLRTTAGKIIMGLSISLLVYQTILLLSQNLTRNAAACSIAAIFLHYAILSAFAWMSVMSYEVWNTFVVNGK